MNDDVAIAMLAAVAAVVAAFGFVGRRFLDAILDETDEPPSPGALDDAELEKRRALLVRLNPAATLMMLTVAALAVGLVVAAGTAIATMTADGTATWPLLSVVAVAFVWAPTGVFVVRRCRLLAGDLASVVAEQSARAPRSEAGGGG